LITSTSLAPSATRALEAEQKPAVLGDVVRRDAQQLTLLREQLSIRARDHGCAGGGARDFHVHRRRRGRRPSRSAGACGLAVELGELSDRAPTAAVAQHALVALGGARTRSAALAAATIEDHRDLGIIGVVGGEALEKTPSSSRGTTQ